MRPIEMPETLAQITAPHFCAGIVMRGDRCTDAAPILRWAVGKTRDELRAYFTSRGWRAVMVQPYNPTQRNTVS